MNNDTFSLYLNWMTSVSVINELAQLKGYVNNANENCMTSKQTRLSTDVIIRSNLRLAHKFRENKGENSLTNFQLLKCILLNFSYVPSCNVILHSVNDASSMCRISVLI